METVIIIASIIGALTLAVMSPGPAFFIVTQTAISSSRGNGIALAAGLGVSSVIYGISALAGLHILLAQVEWAYVTFKIIGGLYLILFGL